MEENRHITIQEDKVEKNVPEWQEEFLKSSKIKKQEKYWLEHFKGEIPVLSLTYDFARPVVQTNTYGSIEFDIDLEQTEKLINLAKKADASVDCILLTVFYVLMHKYSGQEDMVIGSTVLGNLQNDLNDVMGNFENILALRNKPEGEKTFINFLSEVRDNMVRDLHNKDYPFELMAEKLDILKERGRNPFTVCMFAGKDIDSSALVKKDLSFTLHNANQNVSAFDIKMECAEGIDRIKFRLKYAIELYKKETIERMAQHVTNIISVVTEKPEILIREIAILSEEEAKKILFDFNKTDITYPTDVTISDLFEMQVGKNPDNIALVDGEKSFTYREVNEKVNKIASILRAKGVGTETIVAVLLERSADLIIGLLGILKAGGTFLTIDIKNPIERIKYILEDSKAKLLYTNSELGSNINVSTEKLTIEDLEQTSVIMENVLHCTAKPENAAYIIYTSGTTGNPKGVVVEHRELVNFCFWFNQYFQVTSEIKASQYAGIGFDASMCEIFPYLIVGASIYIISEELRLNIFDLNEYIEANHITITFLPTQVCEQFIKFENKCLKKLLTGGEKLKNVEQKSYGIYNLYGPTECTVASTSFHVDGIYNNIPVGKPISNTKIYILDQFHKIQPIGVPGELYIAGKGITRGYLNNKELTERVFIDNPFEPGTKMYRTKDLARWLPDGNIEYLGRVDSQVKIRGYRIEIGEIENQLLLNESIKEAVVIDKEDPDGRKSLCAYVVTNLGVTEEELVEYLSQKLPEYMIPSYFMFLERLQLTPNGKIDRRALPEPNYRSRETEKYEQPVSKKDVKLANIWSEILGIEKIGLNDNFLKLGGHSLKATVLSTKIRKEFGVDMPLHEIFRLPVLRDMSEWISVSKKETYLPLEKVEEKEYYPVSSAQKRLYILSQKEGVDTNYNMPFMSMIIEGKLDIERFEGAFRQLVDRHESLRTGFELVDGQIVQRIYKKVDVHVTYMHCAESDAESIMIDFIKPFDLATAPLIRVALVEFAVDKHLMLFDMHHIISDGISSEIITREFISLYKGETLPPLVFQYKDFTAWQEKLLKGEEIQNQERYWLDRFSGEVPVLNLPYDHARLNVQSFQCENIQFSLDADLSNRLKKFAAEENATLYMILLASLNVLLYKYSGQEDIVVGSAIAGRRRTELDNIVGMFVNTLAMRNMPTGEKTFKKFLAEVSANSMNAYENQDYLFEDLVEKLGIHWELGRNPLFDVMFVLENMDKVSMDIEGLKLVPVELKNKVAKFDLTLFAMENENTIDFNLEYNASLFDKETVCRMTKHFVQILVQITEEADTELRNISVLSEEEKNQILTEFNNTESVYPKDQAIQELFEEQVQKTPDKIAVVFDERMLTYQELNEKANSLARILRSKGVVQDTIVGIMVERSIEMVVGILAILKAGGAYLPIDSKYPVDRVTFMLQDSGTNILLTHRQLTKNYNLELDEIDLEDGSQYAGDNSNLDCVNTQADLAYIIYTSGSTGIPKGVMVEHRNVVRLVKNTNYIEFKEDDRILQTGAIVFDASTFELWGALLNGLTLYEVEEEVILNAKKLSKALQKYEITTLWLTSSLFNQLAVQDNKMFDGLRTLLVGGDVLSPKSINSVRNSCSRISIVNGYGPTENTTFSVCFNIDKNYEDNIPIGKPISNSTAYIVDKYGSLQPVGVPGELWVGGDGVARGYLNRPELTNEKFCKDIFNEGGKLYKTGDLVKWLPSGNIEFLGRIDQQVKIRGFRIELGEVESAILTYDKVKEAVVITKENDSYNKHICAYVVSDEDLALSNIRKHVQKKLPEYMIPSSFIQIEKMPLTKNGKIDKAKLLQMEGKMINATEYVEPVGEVEVKLKQIWEDVLQVSHIGATDNFFEIGGQSLNATVVIAKIHKELNVNLPFKELFRNPRLRDLANYIESEVQSTFVGIQHVGKLEGYAQDYYPASSAQRRMYMIFQIDPLSIAYNVPITMEIDGNVDKEQMEDVFRKLIKRHGALRTSFEFKNGELLQHIKPDVDFELKYSELCNEDEEENVLIDKAIESFIQPFNLNGGPLYRAELKKLSDNKYLILFDVHHIISDGVSLNILMKDFIDLYEGKTLDKVEFDYKDFTLWQNEQIKNGVFEAQGQVLKEKFSGELPVLNMPTDFPRPAMSSYRGDHIKFAIDKKLADKLNNIATKTGSTLYMVLLATFNVLIYKYSGQEDIIVGSPVAGRRHADLQNIMGLFVNTIAIRSQLDGKETFLQLLESIKENTLLAYENQDYPFEELVNDLQLQRDLSRNPLFDVMFTLQKFGKEHFTAGNLKFSFYPAKFCTSKFDLSLDAIEQDYGIDFQLEYALDLFKESTCKQLIKHYLNLLKVITENDNIKLSDIDVLLETERKQILVDFNNTQMDYEKDKTIPQLFEQRVKKSYGKIAVYYEGTKLTYDELNVKVNQLAHRLREYKIQRDEVIPIVYGRSIEMIVGMLAVLKAGGAYLPIDPEYPVDRVKYMIEDSKARILLTHQQHVKTIDFEGEIICLEDESNYTGNGVNPENRNSPTDLAYVMYTSGTTGKPKGVMIEHKSVANLSEWYNRNFGYDEDKKVLHMSNVSFDATVSDIFPSLLYGASIYIINRQSALDKNELRKFINKHAINIAQFVPMTLKELIAPFDKMESLTNLMVAGDRLDESLKDHILSLGYKLSNHYGPTEGTVDSVVAVCDTTKSTIGKPIGNTKVYILDKYRNLVPIGVAGELHVAGDGLARGYLNRPDLTAEKFVPSPFAENEIMYKTGDLACWMSDGNISFLGRVDNQIKIRGCRIEPEEVEKQLLKHEQIKDAVVVDKIDKWGNKYLCGYIVANISLTLTELRTHLLQDLPEYMVPTSFVQMDKFPETPNGKIDLKALPEPTGSVETGNEYIAPESELENKLVHIWNDILQISLDKISTNTAFFDLGGNSLSLVQMSNRVNAEFGVNLKITDLFNYSSIKQLSELIEATRSSDDESQEEDSEIIKFTL